MSPFVVFIIVIVVVALILWATKIRTKKVENRSPEWSASAKCKICGQDNPAEARFCGNCGATLPASAEPPSPAAAPRPFAVPRKWFLIGALAILVIIAIGYGLPPKNRTRSNSFGDLGVLICIAGVSQS